MRACCPCTITWRLSIRVRSVSSTPLISLRRRRHCHETCLWLNDLLLNDHQDCWRREDSVASLRPIHNPSSISFSSSRTTHRLIGLQSLSVDMTSRAEQCISTQRRHDYADNCRASTAGSSNCLEMACKGLFQLCSRWPKSAPVQRCMQVS